MTTKADTTHTPVRTCAGCGRRDEQSSLVRHVVELRDGTALVHADPDRRLAGRGVYVHGEACMRQLLERRSVARVLRIPAGCQAELAADGHARVPVGLQTIGESETGM